MSGGGLVEVLRGHQRYLRPGGWCICGEWPRAGRRIAYTDHLAEVVTAHLAARLEGCREEVAEAIYRGVVIDEAECEGDVAAGALDVVRAALGLSPETQGAALSASDGADGPEGHREATRAGDSG